MLKGPIETHQISTGVPVSVTSYDEDVTTGLLMSAYGTGEFCWAELVTTDEGEALPFYQGLLGLSDESMESEDGSAYYMMKAKNDYVFGLYEASESHSQWSSYICVKDASKIATQVEGLGGFIEQEPMQVMDAGTFATFVDNTGASFSVWQPGHHKGSTAERSAPGMFGWNELATSDAAEAAKFYSELFGWKATTKKGKDGPYIVMSQKSGPVCGITEFGEEFEDVTSHWLLYFNVKDCAKAVAKVEELGGSVFHQPVAHTTVGQYSVIRDLSGAVLALMGAGGKGKKKTTTKKAKKKATKKKSS